MCTNEKQEWLSFCSPPSHSSTLLILWGYLLAKLFLSISTSMYYCGFMFPEFSIDSASETCVVWICPVSFTVLVSSAGHTLNTLKFTSAMGLGWGPHPQQFCLDSLPQLRHFSHPSCLSCVFCNLNAFYLFLRSCLALLSSAIEAH